MGRQQTYYGSVVYNNDVYIMVYMNFLTEHMGFGKAISTDGIHWTKNVNNPYFTGLNTANNWSDRPLTPYLIKVSDGYRVYYNSTSEASDPQAIGFLTVDNF